MKKTVDINRVIDLTLPLNRHVTGFAKETVKTIAQDGWNASTLSIYSHSGTHMDAPIHFGVNDITIDKLELHQLIVTASVVDVSDIGPKGLISVSHLDRLEKAPQSGEAIIFHTGWSKKLGTPDYRNELPRISEELAKWLVNHNITMICVEPPSVADVNDLKEVTKIHEILLGGGVIIVEGLTNLDQLSQQRVTIIALPLKVEGGDGAPARVIAIE